MKSFKAFHLDHANHTLWRNEERVPLAPKPFDVLSYLVEHAGRVVGQDEMLEALWSETYVNPEILRKYILEIRKVLGDRPDNPEFIETVPKRGYRFIATVIDERPPEPPDLSQPDAVEEQVEFAPVASEQQRSSGKHRSWNLAILSAVAIILATAVGGGLLFKRKGPTAPALNDPSVAVLPFEDLSAGKDQEYFSDGLTEQLTHNLARIPGLKVVAKSSTFQFKGKNADARVVGQELGVANILEGSVRRQGNHVRITAELIKVDTGFELWAQTYDREIKDIFAVQDEIALAATEALKLKLLGGNGQPVAPNLRSTNPELYQAYLQAEYYNERGVDKETLGEALAYVDRAIALDGGYAPAWALRASVENRMARYSFTDVTEGFRRSRDDAERAIALDPTAASGYLALASTQIYYDWDWDTANTCVNKATTLEPGNVLILTMRSLLAEASGNLDEAVKFDEQAVEIDPLRATLRAGLGRLLYMAGRYDEARAALRKASDLNSQIPFVPLILSKILIAEGKPQQALLEIEKEPNDWAKLTGQALVYHALGRKQDSNGALAGLIAKHATDSAYQVAEVYAYRGESDKAFQWLERAYDQRDSGLPTIKSDPLLKSLRHDPRYFEFLKKMRLPA